MPHSVSSDGRARGRHDDEASDHDRAPRRRARRPAGRRWPRHRYFLRFTARDLTDEQARQRTTVSELSLGGLIKHVAARRAGLGGLHPGGPVGAGRLGAMTEADCARRADEFRLLPGETLAGVLADYEEVAQRTDELVASLPDLDVAHPLPKAPWFPPGDAAVGPPGVPAHHRRDRAARRPRRHHPRGPRRRQDHGLTAGRVRAGGPSGRGCLQPPSRCTPRRPGRAGTPRRPGGAGGPRRPGGRARSAEPASPPG